MKKKPKTHVKKVRSESNRYTTKKKSNIRESSDKEMRNKNDTTHGKQIAK